MSLLKNKWARLGILLILLAVLCFFVFRDNSKRESTNNTLRVIPADAVVVVEFTKMQTLFSFAMDSTNIVGRLCDPQSVLIRILNSLYHIDAAITNDSSKRGSVKQCECSVSFHSTGRNLLDALLCIETPSTADEYVSALFSGVISGKVSGTYDGIRIRVADISGVQMFVSAIDNFIIISPSDVVIKSCMRNYHQNGALLGEEGFRKVEAATQGGDYRIFVRSGNLSNLFATYLGRKPQKVCRFIASSADWFSFAGECSGVTFNMKGNIFGYNSIGRFFNCFYKHNKREFKSLEVIPPRAMALFSMAVDNEKFPNSYNYYVEMQGKSSLRKEKMDSLSSTFGQNMDEWAKMLCIDEVSMAYIPVADSFQYVTVLHSEHINSTIVQISLLSKMDLQGINPNPMPSMVGDLFGNMWYWNTQECLMFHKDFVILGSEGYLKQLKQMLLSDNFYSFKDNAMRSPISSLVNSKSNFLTIVQPEIQIDTFLSYFDMLYRPSLERIDFNSQYLALSIGVEDETLGMNLMINAENVPRPYYLPPIVPVKSVKGFIADSLLQRSGPYIVYNHQTKENNTLEFANGKLTQKDGKNRVLWSRELKGPIVDSLAQIDIYRNGKLQTLFAAGDKLYLLDRLGRNVEKLPISLPDNVLYGPFLFDQNNEDYAIFVVLENGDIYRFTNLEGDILEADKPWFSLGQYGYLVAQPKRLSLYGKGYWVISASAGSIILTDDGEAKVSLLGKWILNPLTEFVEREDNIVECTTFEGKCVKFSIATGERVK